MNEKRIYTTSELENMSIYDLRLVLRSLGGVPKSKKGREMINEILDIQMGNKKAEKLSNRGRKPKIARLEDNNRDCNESNAIFPEFPGGGSPFTEMDLSDKNYYEDGVSAPLTIEVRDAGCEPERVVLASGILLFLNGEGYLCDMTQLSNPLYYYVDKGIIFSYDLKAGDKLIGNAVFNKNNGFYSLVEVVKLNGYNVADFNRGKEFDRLNSIYPNESLICENESDKTIRELEFIAPIGKGSRALIVAPQKSGASTMIRSLATSIKNQNSSVKLVTLLVDEKPEDISEFASILKSNELYSFCYDDGSIQKIKLVDLILKNAKTLAESGEDVVILVSSITNLAKAYYSHALLKDKYADSAEQTAIIEAKKLLLAGRKTVEAGSLTVIATATESDSSFDKELLLQLQCNANCQIHLSSELAKRRIFPAINLEKSVTDRDERLLSETKYAVSVKLKAILSNNSRANELFNQMINSSANNSEFCKKFAEWERALK